MKSNENKNVSLIYLFYVIQRHLFHYSCLEKWLTKKVSCPICREIIVIKNRKKKQIIYLFLVYFKLIVEIKQCYLFIPKKIILLY